jgi:hypothetical protein
MLDVDTWFETTWPELLPLESKVSKDIPVTGHGGP